jgi:hypothetical protein
MRKRSGRPPRYAAVPNETIDDAVSLDFMALALLAVLLRHRDGWDITLERIGAQYGYGRDALAKAMGLLQVARYVVKVRMMSVDGNQWSTEMCVYDTPASEAEVEALLVDIRRDPAVRVAQVIEPTAAAREHARKRRAKLAPQAKGRTAPSVAVPRVPEIPDSGATRENEVKPQVVPECGFSRQSGDPALFKKTIDQKTKNRPSVPEQSAEGSKDGGTDGPVVPHQISRNEGVDLLLAIGAEKPEFLLTGTTLRDQGLTVLGMLDVGWTAEQLWQVIAGRPLPDPIRTSVGAVVSSRLRAALSSPVPGCVPPGQSWRPEEKPTPFPANWKAGQVQPADLPGECEGDAGLCGRPTEPGSRYCRRCANATINV